MTAAAITAVDFQNLTKFYKVPGLFKSQEVCGIRDLTFQVETGEVFGVLGLNGNGKTTAMRCLLGLIRPSSGRVFVLGREAAEDIGVHSELGYLPESVSLAPALTPREILTLFANLDRSKFSDRNKTRRRIHEVLEVVGLSSAADRQIRTFSKGMTQRAGIAQAILHEPKILVLDEPASGLDPLGIVEMRELFARLNRDLKMTVLFSSHSIGEVERVASRVAIIVHNRLVKILERREWDGSGGKPLETWFLECVKT